MFVQTQDTISDSSGPTNINTYLVNTTRNPIIFHVLGGCIFDALPAPSIKGHPILREHHGVSIMG